MFGRGKHSVCSIATLKVFIYLFKAYLCFVFLQDILNIPDEEKSFHRFKVGLLDLKTDYGNLKEKVEFMEISRL